MERSGEKEGRKERGREMKWKSIYFISRKNGMERSGWALLLFSNPFCSVPFLIMIQKHRENSFLCSTTVLELFQNRLILKYPVKRKKQEQTRTLLCLMFSVSPNQYHESYFIEFQLKVIFCIILIPLFFSLKLIKNVFQLLPCPIKTLMLVVLSPTLGLTYPVFIRKIESERRLCDTQ